MKTQSQVLLLGAAIVTLASLGINHWREAKPQPLLRCAWDADNRAAYRLNVSSTGTFFDGILSGNAGLSSRQVSLQYVADLEVRAAEGGDHANAYVAKLQLLTGFETRDATFKADLAKPFSFQMDDRCRFGEFGFTAEEGRESRELKKSFLLVMEAVSNPSEDATEWQAKQTDAVGDYEAVYRHNVETGQITRNRLYYSKTTPFAESVLLKAEISKSFGSFTPRADFWLEEATVQEAMRIATEEGQTFIQLSAYVSLELLKGAAYVDADVTRMTWEGIRVDESFAVKNSS